MDNKTETPTATKTRVLFVNYLSVVSYRGHWLLSFYMIFKTKLVSYPIAYSR